MISPYRSEINLMKLNVSLAVKNQDYDSACNYLDRLSLLFLEEVASYSNFICESQEILETDKEIPEENRKRIEGFLEKLSKELTLVNREWKNEIELRELYDGGVNYIYFLIKTFKL